MASGRRVKTAEMAFVCGKKTLMAMGLSEKGFSMPDWGAARLKTAAVHAGSGRQSWRRCRDNHRGSGSRGPPDVFQGHPAAPFYAVLA